MVPKSPWLAGDGELGHKRGGGRRTVSPRPSHFSDFDLLRNQSVSSMRGSECRDR